MVATGRIAIALQIAQSCLPGGVNVTRIWWLLGLTRGCPDRLNRWTKERTESLLKIYRQAGSRLIYEDRDIKTPCLETRVERRLDLWWFHHCQLGLIELSSSFFSIFFTSMYFFTGNLMNIAESFNRCSDNCWVLALYFCQQFSWVAMTSFNALQLEYKHRSCMSIHGCPDDYTDATVQDSFHSIGDASLKKYSTFAQIYGQHDTLIKMTWQITAQNPVLHAKMYCSW